MTEGKDACESEMYADIFEDMRHALVKTAGFRSTIVNTFSKPRRGIWCANDPPAPNLAAVESSAILRRVPSGAKH